jgi:hypothetical protein
MGRGLEERKAARIEADHRQNAAVRERERLARKARRTATTSTKKD